MIDVVNVFSQRLAAAMDKAQLSQYMLAMKLGVSQSTICGYLNGSLSISIGRLASICEILNVSADYLLGLSDY